MERADPCEEIPSIWGCNRIPFRQLDVFPYRVQARITYAQTISPQCQLLTLEV